MSARVVADSLRYVIETLKEVGISDASVIRELVGRIPIVELGHYGSLIKHVQRLTEDLLKRRMFKDKDGEEARKIAEKLVSAYEYHGHVIHYEEAERIGVKIRVLEGEVLGTLYEYYKKIRWLFNDIDRILEPLIIVIRDLPGPPIEKYESKHGLIYMPSRQIVQQIQQIVKQEQ